METVGVLVAGLATIMSIAASIVGMRLARRFSSDRAEPESTTRGPGDVDVPELRLHLEELQLQVTRLSARVDQMSWSSHARRKLTHESFKQSYLEGATDLMSEFSAKPGPLTLMAHPKSDSDTGRDYGRDMREPMPTTWIGEALSKILADKLNDEVQAIHIISRSGDSPKWKARSEPSRERHS